MVTLRAGRRPAGATVAYGGELCNARSADLIIIAQLTGMLMDKRRLELRRLVRIVGRALQSGGVRHSLMRSEWNVAGDCQTPKWFALQARPTARETIVQTTIFDQLNVGHGAFARHKVTAPYRLTDRYVVVSPGKPFPLVLEMWTRCRRCDKCRQARSRLWRHRVREEVRTWPRTWFGTITISPASHHWFWLKALERSRGQSVEVDRAAPGEQFLARNREISVELTKMLKRVRQNTRAPMRYILVCEQHKSGLPHYHMLIHECSTMWPIRHKELNAQWPYGFTKWKLVNDEAEATYLCKYISKSGVARVRASTRYGDGLMAIVKREKPLDLPITNQIVGIVH